MNGKKQWGVLEVQPELSWDDLKNTAYIPHELHKLQGRVSSRHADFTAIVEDRLIETVTGTAFVKYADTFELRNTSLYSSYGGLRSITSYAGAVDELIQTFPEHVFSGSMRLYRTECEDLPSVKVEVEDNKITVLESYTDWRVLSGPVKAQIDRWKAGDGWSKVQAHQRLGEAVELLHLMIGRREIEAAMHEHEPNACPQGCLHAQVLDFLRDEGVLKDEPGHARAQRMHREETSRW